VPDSAGNAWLIQRVTTDTILHISFFVSATTPYPMWVGLRVNGRLWRAPWSHRGAGVTSLYDTQLLKIFAPVPSGTTLIQPVYAHTTRTDDTPNTWDTTFEDRSIVVRELLR
jgi:hypothetical protein